MPAATVFIDQNPQKAQPEKSPGNYGAQKAQKSLFPADRFAVESQYFQFPCPEPQGLSTMSPEPGIKKEADSE